MFSLVHLINRNWASAHPSIPASEIPRGVEIWTLGSVRPQALIDAAKSHSEVIITVAARDAKRAQAYAKKHGIPIVHKSYQELIDDPAIDAVYIPLPNGLHFEWAIKSLKAGKHVLLEKPSVSNTTEAESLFRHELLKQPNAPILLEAFHIIFHPTWQYYLSLLEPSNIVSASI